MSTMLARSAALALSCITCAEALAQEEPLCAQISEGEIVGADGLPLSSGPNAQGYDYELHKFEGPYCDTMGNTAACAPYANVRLTMLWNDAWLSNQDCDGDELLDRHFGYASYRGSGAELTNIMTAPFERDGEACEWHYVTWFAAAPLDATLVNGVWMNADGTRLGAAIWTHFATVNTLYQEVCGDDATVAEEN
jgi:hypothetical protein